MCCASPISRTETVVLRQCKVNYFQISPCSLSDLWPIGHECWIMNGKVRSRVQVAEMGFMRRIKGLILLDEVKSADIHELLNIEFLLLRL